MALSAPFRAPIPGLRPAAAVMVLERLGSFHQTRLSFVRSLLRKVMREHWLIGRVLWEIDDAGHGTCVYRVNVPPDEVYSLVFFSHHLPEEKRTDRVIAEAWDVTFVLCEGMVDREQVADLRQHVPLQENGRYLPYVLVLSRANRSTRIFDHVLERLAQGKQPDPDQLARVGYLYRTTAVYGNGKFGLADFHKLQRSRAFAATFRAQMFAVWMLRHFALEQIHYLARVRNPNAAVLHLDLQRYLGVGNATGLGMAPFLVTHPRLIHQWIITRERAILRVLNEGVATPLKLDRLAQLLDRARQHVREIETVHPLQQSKNDRMLTELTLLGKRLTPNIKTWRQLVDIADEMSCETQEVVNSILLELHPDLVDELAEEMGADEAIDLQPEMPIAALSALIKQDYSWALAIDFTRRENEQWFWYRSAEKEEPRLGDRWQETGAEKEQALDIARSVARLYRQLREHPKPEATVVEFLLDYPWLRGIIKRVQAMRHAPYGEIRDNLIGRECLPIHLLRCKLSFFGASKFDPRSNLWVRITLFQGAPLVDDIGSPFGDDWFWPVKPSGSASSRPLRQRLPAVKLSEPVPGRAFPVKQDAFRTLPQAARDSVLTVSHNEIVMLCRKLFETFGCAVGDYEEAAEMIAWCELHGLPFLRTFRQDLGRFQDPYAKRLTICNHQSPLTELDARGQSCLLVGALAADWGFHIALRDGVSTTVLDKTRHQLPLLAYLLRLGHRGVQMAATWNEDGGLGQVTAIISPDSHFPTVYRYRRSSSPHIAQPGTDWLRIVYSFRGDLPFSNRTVGNLRIVTPADFAAHFAHHRDHGIAVDAGMWSALTEVSKGILVEASDESRQRGAGE